MQGYLAHKKLPPRGEGKRGESDLLDSRSLRERLGLEGRQAPPEVETLALVSGCWDERLGEEVENLGLRV